MAGIAVVGANDNAFNLNNFDDVAVLSLTVQEPGAYVVFGRVVVTNSDGSNQNARAVISHSNRTSNMDWVDVRVSNDSSFALSLEGTLFVSPGAPKVLELRCFTFRGVATRPWLIAVQVDRLSNN